MQHYRIEFDIVISEKDYMNGLLETWVVEKMREIADDPNCVSRDVLRIWRKV